MLIYDLFIFIKKTLRNLKENLTSYYIHADGRPTFVWVDFNFDRSAKVNMIFVPLYSVTRLCLTNIEAIHHCNSMLPDSCMVNIFINQFLALSIILYYVRIWFLVQNLLSISVFYFLGLKIFVVPVEKRKVWASNKIILFHFFCKCISCLMNLYLRIYNENFTIFLVGCSYLFHYSNLGWSWLAFSYLLFSLLFLLLLVAELNHLVIVLCTGSFEMLKILHEDTVTAFSLIDCFIFYSWGCSRIDLPQNLCLDVCHSRKTMKLGNQVGWNSIVSKVSWYFVDETLIKQIG